MLNWLKRQIAGKELAELNRYRLASAEAFRWNVGHVPAAAETADWIIRVAEGVTPLSPEKLRDRLMRPNVEFSGVPAGHSSNHPAGGTSAGTQG